MRYTQDEEFRQLCDGLDETKIREYVNWITIEMVDNGDALGQLLSINSNWISRLFDSDLILTFRDRLTAPVYIESKTTELVAWMETSGFTDIKRLSRYPSFKNVWRFLSPLYSEYDHPLSKLMYGEGFVQLIGRKTVQIQNLCLL